MSSAIPQQKRQQIQRVQENYDSLVAEIADYARNLHANRDGPKSDAINMAIDDGVGELAGDIEGCLCILRCCHTAPSPKAYGINLEQLNARNNPTKSDSLAGFARGALYNDVRSKF